MSKKSWSQKLSGIARATVARVRSFHRQDDAQMLLIGAIFTFVLVVLLTVTVNLATVTFQKIQAQNAADAAATAAGIWQIRGLSLVQTLNNAVVLSDGVAVGALAVAVVLNAAVQTPPPVSAGAVIAGNAALILAVGCHAASQFVLIPFRHVYAYVLAPMLCYVSASEMARANNATPVLESLVPFGGALLTAKADAIVMGLLSTGSDSLVQAFRDQPGVQRTASWGNKLLEGIPDIYAMNLELAQWPPRLIDLGLDYSEDIKYEKMPNGKPNKPETIPAPLLFTDFSLMLDACYLLTFASVADRYFSTLERIGETIDNIEDKIPDGFDPLKNLLKMAPHKAWKHDYLMSVPDFPEKDPQCVRLPETTWVTIVRESNRAGGRYGAWTAAWKPMGGLGVKNLAGEYGELGALAMSKMRVFADPVSWFDFSAYRGWVELIPINDISLLGENHDIGVAH